LILNNSHRFNGYRSIILAEGPALSIKRQICLFFFDKKSTVPFYKIIPNSKFCTTLNWFELSQEDQGLPLKAKG